ncbi:MAG: pyridoxal phosphate-dependent aminotransferase [Candidatus Dormibacteraeota bacterium]|uniref:Aminotransferase n=1 Tax=Candidatus Dormiibacter inghamiae TaxID=3127013 RepID=A0A934NDM1_9BACT|nr:pyridoxal phosphate-dependent aminotransferase [Candidatus Dormibacteraeota bacterium]MBJ7606505.1 pyridoxal phosphate-dependent aminotransferase [Candidatus Dormibacteraeota bacterium]
MSERARLLRPSATIATDARAKALAASGVDVVNLTAGEPDFDTMPAARSGGLEAIEAGFTRYTPVAGIPELRAAIAEKLLRDNGISCEPEQIVVSNGAKQSIYNALMVLVDPGDEVIMPSPCWVSYPEIVSLAGGVPVLVDTSSNGYRLSAEAVAAAVTSRTKVVMLNSPSNPVGTVATDAELRELVALCVARDLYVISDEIYEKLVYGSAEFVSIASLGEEIQRLTITVNGFSKAYAMTGWRMGYAAAEPQIVAAMTNLQSQCTSGASSISQRAALAALNGDQAPLESMRQQFDRRRQLVLQRLSAMPGVVIEAVPEGAFYIFPRVSDIYGRMASGNRSSGSVGFADFLLEAARVAVVPGLPFGSDDHIRVSYASSLERLAEGMNRIESVVRSL